MIVHSLSEWQKGTVTRKGDAFLLNLVEFNKHWLNGFYVPGTVQGAGEGKMKILCPCSEESLTLLGRTAA